MKLSAILLFVAIAILGYAYSLSPYKDEALFMERYTTLSEGQSNEYSKLRDEMLTPKYELQDYGVTLVAIAVGVFFTTRKGWRKIKSPTSRATLIGVAFAAPLLTVGGYVFDLLQAFDRGEFPYWADSMAIPLMGVPLLLLVFLVWAGMHLAFLPHNYQSVPLSLAVSRKSNWWLLFISAVTVVLVVLGTWDGHYWYAIPGVVWFYLYISLAACHRVIHAS